MAMSYHMEARIKQDRLNRWNDQKRRAGLETTRDKEDDVAYKQKMDKVLSADPGHFNQIRPPSLPMFRVNQDGYRNRYQNRQHLNPHVDQAFPTLYPGSDFSDYNSDDNRVHRRLNSAVDRYQVSEKVNGKFHMQLLKDTNTVEHDLGEKKFKNWNPPKKERPVEPVPKLPPSSVLNLKRDRVYKILHPLGHAIFHKHRNAQNLPEDNVYPLIHPKEKNFRVPEDQLPKRKPHLKV